MAADLTTTTASPAAPTIDVSAAPGSLADSYPQRMGAYLKMFRETMAPAREQRDIAEQGLERTYAERVEPAARAVSAEAATPLPPIPRPLPAPPTPDIRPRPFLSTEGRQAIPAVINSLGLLAQNIVGAMGAPVAGLSAMTGAMNGWAKGDDTAAARSWRMYLAEVDRIRTENDLAQQAWQDAMQQSGTNLERRKAAFIARAAELDRPKLALQAASMNVHDLESDLQNASQTLNTLETNALRLEQEIAREQIAALHASISKGMLDMKAREVALKEQEQKYMMSLVGGLTPGGAAPGGPAAAGGAPGGAGGPAGAPKVGSQEWLRYMGALWNKGERPYELIRGFGRAATYLLPAIQMEALRQQIEEGQMNPDEAAGARVLAEGTLRSQQGALTTITREKARFETWVTTFEKQVQNAKQLSDRVAKTSVPEWNRAKLEYEARVLGNKEANDLLAAMSVLSRDIDRVLARATGSGSNASRAQAQRLVDPGLTKEQFDSLITNVLDKDALYAVMGFDESQKALERNLRATEHVVEHLPEERAAAKPMLTQKQYEQARAKGVTDDEIRRRGFEPWRR